MSERVDIQTVMIGFVALKKKLEDIERKLDEKKPSLSTEEAVEGFRGYLQENVRPNTSRTFTKLLREFEAVFAGRNIPDIPALEIQGFLAQVWGKSCKRSVLKQQNALLKWFFVWCVKYVQKKGMPPFFNPCDLIEVKGDTTPKQAEFLPVETMRQFLESATDERHWLIFSTLLTSGMRISELIGDARVGKKGIRKCDIKGGAITIWAPKSGKEKETAVIPTLVADRLDKYMKTLGPQDPVFSICHSTVYDVVTTHSRRCGHKFSPHYLRKWCASFWDRQGDYAMRRAVLRHSSVKGMLDQLEGRYVAPLSVEEAQGRMDNVLTPLLFSCKDQWNTHLPHLFR